MMALTVSVKLVPLFAEAVRTYCMKRRGYTLTAWTSLTYMIIILKIIVLFSVLILIGMICHLWRLICRGRQAFAVAAGD